MLPAVTIKVLRRIILKRMASVIDPYLRKEQAKVRKGKSCADQIFPWGKFYNRAMNETLLYMPTSLT